MSELEELQKEFKELKEKNEALAKENTELKEKIEKADEPEDTETKDTKDENGEKETVEKGENKEPEKMVISKEDIPEEVIAEITKSVRDGLMKDKDSLLEALGLTKYEPNQDSGSLSELVKSGEDGVQKLDPVKLYEMTKEGEQMSRNSDLDGIPDVNKSIEELYEGA